MKAAIASLILLSVASPLSAKTHHDIYPVACGDLWAATKDTLKFSGKYGIIGISNEEMTASYNIGGGLAGKRINSVVLAPAGSGCDMQTQTAFTGLAHNDALDFRKRVEKSLEKISEERQPSSAKVESEPRPASASEPPARGD